MRLVDAKFALPHKDDKQPRTEEHQFTCLDLPEYPGEHDDITIGFDGVAGKFLTLDEIVCLR